MITYIALFCGDREWTDRGPIRRELKRILRKHSCDRVVIIEGEAPGADQLSRWEAESLGIHTAGVRALWNFYHRPAGPKRNTAMLGLKPDEVVAFHANIEESKGTKDMVDQATKAGIPCKVVAK